MIEFPQGLHPSHITTDNSEMLRRTGWFERQWHRLSVGDALITDACLYERTSLGFQRLTDMQARLYLNALRQNGGTAHVIDNDILWED